MKVSKPAIFILQNLIVWSTLLAIAPGQEAPAIMFRTLDNEMIFSNDYVGEPRILRPDAPRVNTLLIFFRSDDPNVSMWLPMLLSETEAINREVLKTFLISVDENPENLKSFRKDHKIRPGIYIDKFGAAVEVLELGNVSDFSRTPGVVLLDQTGTVRYYQKKFNSDHIADLILKISSLLQ